MTPTDEAHAAVLDWILAMPKGARADEAHRAYQGTRLSIRPLLLRQKSLLERALLLEQAVLTSQPARETCAALDAQVTALDAEIAAAWLGLETQLARGAA